MAKMAKMALLEVLALFGTLQNLPEPQKTVKNGYFIRGDLVKITGRPFWELWGRPKSDQKWPKWPKWPKMAENGQNGQNDQNRPK